MHPFIRGESYDREQVLAFLGSKQSQSGIVHGMTNPEYIAIFTGGRHAKEAGYEDGWRSDGIFLYCGQGSKGSQKLAGSNKVLAAHGGIVLLFETWKPKNSWKGRQRFSGEYRVLGHEWVAGRGLRDGDQLLIFSLIPIEYSPRDEQLPVVSRTDIDIAILRAKAIEAGQPVVPARITNSEYRSRSAMVARYVLARANGICESCKKLAPFTRSNGSPYLEIHHTRRLCDEGPDDIMYVAGICPNCHREAHFGPDIAAFRKRLEEMVAKNERSGH